MGYDETLKNIELVNKENNSQGKTDKNENKKRLLKSGTYINHVTGRVWRVCRGFFKFFQKQFCRLEGRRSKIFMAQWVF